MIVTYKLQAAYLSMMVLNTRLLMASYSSFLTMLCCSSS